MKLPIVVAILGSSALLSSAALAQRSDTTTLEPVVISATRIATPVSAISQPVTVLNGDELRARGVTTVAEALREAPGISVAQSGSYGGVTSVFMRGGESRYTKVLIDGTPINSVGGVQFFEHLSLDNVDRIEIVYGPSSALYGADAVSGVIQIFTKRGSGAPRLDADVRAGSYNSRDGSASVRGGGQLADYSFGGGWHSTDGVAAFNNGYSNGDLSAALQFRPDDLSAIGVTARYSGSVYHFPTDYAGAVVDSTSYSSEHRLVLGLDASRRVTDAVRLSVKGGDNEIHGLSEDTHTSTTAPLPRVKVASPTDGYRRFGEARMEVALGLLGVATAGAQYQVEEQRMRTVTTNFATTTAGVAPTVQAGPDDARTTRGVYVALQGTPVRRLSYDMSLRRDVHSDFGSVTTYHTGASIATWSGARLRASYGTGFNAPAFYATQGSAYNAPNLSLQPEQTHSLDVHIEQLFLHGIVRASVGGFDQRFSNQIQYVPGTFGGPPDYTQLTPASYSNLTQARAKGYEGEIHAVLPSGLTASANYTQVIARVYEVPPNYAGSQRPGDALLRRPSHSASGSLFYAPGDVWSIGGSADYVGKRADMDFSKYPSPTLTLAPYVKVGLSGSLRLLRTESASVSLTVRVDNALDRRYEDVYNFPAARRAILIGARMSAGR
ncbi:MAG: TonB-dependent receptor [Gemmatimonadota bacterium]|nr:TonB-dependent receptor [Gemmatimonadota bacterium]